MKSKIIDKNKFLRQHLAEIEKMRDDTLGDKIRLQILSKKFDIDYNTLYKWMHENFDFWKAVGNDPKEFDWSKSFSKAELEEINAEWDFFKSVILSKSEGDEFHDEYKVLMEMPLKYGEVADDYALLFDRNRDVVKKMANVHADFQELLGSAVLHHFMLLKSKYREQGMRIVEQSNETQKIKYAQSVETGKDYNRQIDNASVFLSLARNRIPMRNFHEAEFAAKLQGEVVQPENVGNLNFFGYEDE